MVLAQYDHALMHTPFVKNEDGTWQLELLEGEEIEYGHRFDAGIGYRVFIKFKGAFMSNAFVPGEARKLAVLISKQETNEDILNIGIFMKHMAAQTDKLNQLWAARGCPGAPLDQEIEAGHA